MEAKFLFLLDDLGAFQWLKGITIENLILWGLGMVRGGGNDRKKAREV
jgi:hypothetical protein